MTRRIIKPHLDDRGLRYCNPKTGWEDWHGAPVKCPYGSVGDVLWVRETFHSGYVLDQNDHIPEDAELNYLYYADTRDARPADMSDSMCTHLLGHNKKDWPKWKPPIFMPYDACRLFLRITDIKVEQLQDISEEDAIAEGAEPRTHRCGGFGVYEAGGDIQDCICQEWDSSPEVMGFHDLWESINGPESWEANPFVWVVNFERIDKPE